MKTLRDEMLKHSWQEAMVGPDLVRVDDALSAFRQWLADEGLVVVPAWPTSNMLIDGHKHRENFYSLSGPYARTKAVYTAMIAAAPDALGEKT